MKKKKFVKKNAKHQRQGFFLYPNFRKKKFFHKFPRRRRNFFESFLFVEIFLNKPLVNLKKILSLKIPNFSNILFFNANDNLMWDKNP